MNLLYLLLVFMVVGFGLYLINRFVPMEPTIKTMMNVVVIILLFIWVITILFPDLGVISIGPVRHVR